MKTILKSTLAGAVALALSACGSMQAAPSKPADLYRHGMQRQFKQDTQYNLSGKATFALYETEQSRQMRHERIEDDVKWKAEWAQRDKKPLSAAEQNEIRQEFQEKQARRDKTTQTLFNALSVHYTGAMDLPRGKIELVPELHYETRNALGSLKVPMQLDIKAQAAYVDLGAFEPGLPAAESALSADKPIVRFRLPKQWQNKIPFADVWRALPKAYDESIKALGDDAFTALPLNDTARKIGARHRIALRSNSKQSMESTKALFQSLQQQLREQGKPGNANISQADYDRFVAGLEAISSAVQGMTTAIADKQPPVEYEFYYDGKGRLLAYFATMRMENLGGLMGHGLRIKMEAYNHYTRTPQFTLQATDVNTVDFEQAFPQLAKEWNALPALNADGKGDSSGKK